MAEHSIRVVYDAEILKKGVRAFVWHRLICKGFGHLWLAALLLILPTWLMTDIVWLRWVLLGVLGAVALFVVLAYWANRRLKLLRFRQMNDPAVTMALGEDGFEVTSSLGTSALPWSFLTGILKRPDFWLLFGPKAEYIVLPLAGVSPQALVYLEQKVSSGK